MTDELELRDMGLDALDLDADANEPGGARGAELPEPMVPGAATAPPGYRLLEKLGEGGMGVVHRAVQLTLDRTVAIKFLREGLLGIAGEDMFFGEARSMAKLRHPNVVQVYDAGRVQDRPYLVMDLVEGKSLYELVREWGDQVPIRETFRLIAEACRGVDYCNRQGLVHCDINPRNIMVEDESLESGQGHPFVMDFGIARALGTVTRDTVLDFGTPAYLAPERLKNGAVVDARTDVYALGAVLYFMVTGKHPFTGRNARAVLAKVMDREPIPPRIVNPRLSLDAETIILKSMEKDPALRYQTVEELRLEIERYLAGEAISARRLSFSRRLARFAARHSGALAVLTLALAGFAAGGVYTFLLLEHNDDLERRSRELDQSIKELTFRLEFQRQESETQAEAQRERIKELEQDQSARELAFRKLREELIEQNARLEELLRQKNDLLAEREGILTRREEAQALAEEKMKKLRETSAEARRISEELDAAQQQLAMQTDAIASKERQLREQASILSGAIDEKRQALAEAERLIQAELEKETGALLAMLDDANWRTRVIALDKLGRRGDPRTLPKVVQIAREDTRDDRHNTVEVQVAAIAALGLFPDQPGLLKVYETLAKSNDVEVRMAVLREVSRKLENEEVKFVRKLLSDPATEVVVAAIQVLERDRRAEAADGIGAVLDRLRGDEPTELPVAAVRALAALVPGDERASRRILPLLDSAEAAVATAAASALGHFPFSAVIRRLEKMDSSPFAAARREAVGSLATIAATVDAPLSLRVDAAEGLVEFLLDRDRIAANQANLHLRSLSGKDAGWSYEASDAEKRRFQRTWRSLIKG